MRIYRVKLGNILSYVVYLVITFFLTQVSVMSLVMALMLLLLFFLLYTISYYKGEVGKVINACCSSWSIFMYLGVAIIFAYVQHVGLLENWFILFLFILSASGNFWLMINQKNYNMLTCSKM